MIFKSLNAGYLTRKAAGIVLLLIGIFTLPHVVAKVEAHEGHDHGEKKPKAEAVLADPRFAVETTLFQLVGKSSGNALTFYLDNFASNEPVTDALMDVTVGADNQIAQETSPGIYELSGDWVATSGTHDLIISITAGEMADLIIAQLVIPETEYTSADATIAWWDAYLPAAVTSFIGPTLKSIAAFITTTSTGYLSAIIFGAGLIVGLFIRNTIFPVTSALLIFALVATPTSTYAHEGHDHGEKKKPLVQTGDQPQRLPDGSVFLPKPTQRLLSIRSALAVQSDIPQSERLLGKTISDPSYRGVVQAVRDGHIGFPGQRLPRIGETVNLGDVVATLTPVLTPEAQSGMTEQLGALTQEIAVTEQRLKRLQAASQIVVAGQGSGRSFSAVSKGSIEELVVQLETLISRREALNAISFGSLELKASRSGTISNVNVTTGQVVSAGDTLIEIIDPKRIWVEAIAYPGQNTALISAARAILPRDGSVPLTFVNRSLSLTAQAETLFFRLENDQAVPLGTPVTVLLEGEEAEKNQLVPRNAVVRGNSGLLVIWIQEAPEIFRPQIVDVEPFDGTYVKIKTGLEQDDRFVVQGASFLSQVR